MPSGGVLVSVGAGVKTVHLLRIAVSVTTSNFRQGLRYSPNVRTTSGGQFHRSKIPADADRKTTACCEQWDYF